MSAIYKRVFRVRHYECDRYGHLNNVNYIRYMQETALDASADVGWDASRYETIGHQWIARETNIEFLQPLLWNDEVEITTYIVDFRRVQSWRYYEFRRIADDTLIAQAHTNWVYINSYTNEPARIPDEIVNDFAPDGLPETNKIAKYPKPAQQPDDVFSLKKRVEWRDIDTVGHVNNAAYMAYCEDAATQVGRSLGWSMARMVDTGFALILRRFRIQYLQAAYLDDDVDIRTWYSDVKRATAIRHFDIRRSSDNQQLARAQSFVVCFDLEKQRPIRIPSDFLADVGSNQSPDDSKEV